MPRVILTAAALLFFASLGAAQPPDLRPGDPLAGGLKRLERAEYTEALADFDRALDAYAAARRLDDVKPVYIRLFVGNRHYSNVLMKAMKAWVDRHRADAAGLEPEMFAAFGGWVHERDVLAAATVNLAHNSPDWK